MTNIIIFGDSITWGAVDEEMGGWAERLKTSLSYKDANISKDIDVYNCGVSGDNTADLLKRFEIEAKARLGDTRTIIIFAIGINDSKFIPSKNTNRVARKDFEKNLVKLCRKAKQFTDEIIFLGLTRIDDSKTTSSARHKDSELRTVFVKEYDSMIQKVCKDHKLPYIPVYDELQLDDLYDGLHPNTKGHKKISRKVEKYLKSGKYI